MRDFIIGKIQELQRKIDDYLFFANRCDEDKAYNMVDYYFSMIHDLEKQIEVLKEVLTYND